MRERFRNWMRTPSLRGQLIWLSVSSVLVTLLISLLILVLLINNVMGPFVNREAEFAMQTVSRSLSTKTQLLEDILLRICKSPQMTGEASDARGEQFRSLVDIYSDKNIVAPGLPFVEMAYFMDMRGAFDVVSYHEQLSSEQLRLNEDNLARYRAFQESGTDVQCTASEPYLYIIFTVYDRWADPFGTVIFVVNQSAVTSIMGKLSDYQDAFWYLFDKDGARSSVNWLMPVTTPAIRESLTEAGISCSAKPPAWGCTVLSVFRRCRSCGCCIRSPRRM